MKCKDCVNARKACPQGVVACAFWNSHQLVLEGKAIMGHQIPGLNEIVPPMEAWLGWAKMGARPNDSDPGMMQNNCVLVKEDDSCSIGEIGYEWKPAYAVTF